MKKIFIIAEAGDNHNGKIELAYQLIDKAVEAGADCVKFQTFITEEVISKIAKMADYQKNNTGNEESQFDMVKKLELSFDDFRALKRYCEKRKIMFLSTPFDLPSIEFLNSLDLTLWKIPSGEITNLPYLIKIANTHKDVILSTGMATIFEIEQAIKILNDNGAGKITLLHCTTEYPAPIDEVNLTAIKTMSDYFNLDTGYSDHTQGITIPVAAVAMGAKVIEKHFTLDKNMKGPDHKASLEPDELREMVRAIRLVEASLGDGIKQPTKSEKKNIEIARKSIVARRKIKVGEVFNEENLAIKRPGSGISPMEWFDIIGTKAMHDFDKDELIEI
ncbi:N-acetylneuraminate synthase [Clostridiales bacterium]|nr:N-acetylneuraminate synthase [Clostridiales bacterium]